MALWLWENKLKKSNGTYMYVTTKICKQYFFVYQYYMYQYLSYIIHVFGQICWPFIPFTATVIHNTVGWNGQTMSCVLPIFYTKKWDYIHTHLFEWAIAN